MTGTVTTAEKTIRNKTATGICLIFLVGLFVIIIKGFYYIFHETNATIWDTVHDEIIILDTNT